MRWNNANIGDYRITPLRTFTSSIIGGKQFVHQWPYSRLLVLGRPNHEVEYPLGINIGPAMSSIISFVMRCPVIAYNKFFTPLRRQEDNIQLTLPGKLWSEGWNHIFEHQEGLRSHIRHYHPSPLEEQNIIKTMTQVYDLLMSLDEEAYQSILGAMRLYQLAFFTAREDLSLAYSLLVAAVDTISSSLKTKVKLRDIDPKGKLTKAMAEIGLDEELQSAIKNLVTYDEGLTKRFSTFIIDNLPHSTFWKGDYSVMKELDLLASRYHSGQFLRDLGEGLPEPMRQELLKQADEMQKQYEELKKQRPERERRWLFNKERREWMLNYLQTRLDRVLANTFGSRSELFHRGRSFPKFTLKEEFTDWIPDVFEEDFRDFVGEHFKHKWSYHLTQKGKIFRSCSCGDRKEVKMMLGIRVFERMVHDSIFSYLLKLNNT